MRRGGGLESLMRRWLFNIASGFSLLLFVATCVVWVRSYWFNHAFMVGERAPGTKWFVKQTYLLGANDGWFGFYRSGYPSAWSWAYDEGPVIPATQEGVAEDLDRVYWEAPGFIDGLMDNGPAHLPFRVFVVSFWLIAPVFALLPATWLITFKWRRSRRRIARGLCGACGYDMRGSEGACPECGLAMVKTAGE